MRLLLTPLIALLNRLKFSAKFTLMAGLFSLPLVYLLLLTLSHLNETYQTARNEEQGIRSLSVLQPLLLGVQRHRGLSNAWLSGDTSARSLLDKAAADTDRALDAILGQPFFGTHEPIKSIASKWRTLKNQGASTPPAQSFSAHTALVKEVMTLSEEIADHSQLTLDPVMDSYYLQNAIILQAMPLTEVSGQLRGKASGIMTRKAVTPEEKVVIATLSAQAKDYSEHLTTSLQRALTYNPALQFLMPRLDALSTTLTRVNELTLREVMAEQFSLSATDYFARATAPIDQTLSLLEGASTFLTGLLTERRTSARAAIVVSLVLAAVLLGLMGALASLRNASGRDWIGSGYRAGQGCRGSGGRLPDNR
ncbi:MAG: hypothetical protein WCP34_15025 [Pseudomonadota bacterium]